MWRTELTSLDSRKGKWSFISLTGLFVFLFINLFEPFDTYASPSDPVWDQFLEILFATLGLMAASATAHFGLRPLLSKPSLNYLTILPWFVLELILISLIWSAMEILVEGPNQNFLFLLWEHLVAGFFLISLPYAAALLLLQSRHQSRERKENTNPDVLVPFREKSGKEKMRLPLSRVLFLESSDNYVVVHFLENEGVRTFKLRNTLKNLEQELATSQLVRCHRSFVVNARHIVRMEKGSGGYRLFMRQHESKPVPVSKSYTSEMDKLSRLTSSQTAD